MPGATTHRSTEQNGVKISMRDGESLAGDVWLPGTSGKHPTILLMTPYNRKLLGAALPDPSYKQDILDREHYAYVFVDWRGYFGSADAKSRPLELLRKGQTVLGQLGEDGFDAVEWIAQQPWSNGKVGMWGPSALGRIQFYTAAERPPHLVCAVPLVSEYRYDYGVYYYGGVLKKGYADLLGTAGYGAQRKAAEHPLRDEFWDGLGKLYRPDRIEIPMLLISGWFDLYPEGMVETFHDLLKRGGPAAQRHTRMLIGPWHHTAIGHREQGELEFPQAENVNVQAARRFFDYWLRDQKENGDDREPRVRYYQMGSDEWRSAGDFPGEPASRSIWYPGANDALLAAAPATETARSFRYDPADPSPTVGGLNAFLPSNPLSKTVGAGPRDQNAKVLSRKDALVYRTDVLDRDVELAGGAKVELVVSSDRPDTDFAVRLCDVHPDGRTLLVTDGIQRLRFRDSDRREALATPNQSYRITVALSLTAHTFVHGHRLCLIVTSSNSPRFDTNPNIERKRLLGPAAAVATNTVHHGGAQPSALILPARGSPK